LVTLALMQRNRDNADAHFITFNKP